MEIDDVIARIEDMKEACADEGDGCEPPQRAIHNIHAGIYVKVLSVLESMREGNTLPAGGVRAERMQIDLLKRVKTYVEDGGELFHGSEDASRDSYAQFTDWIIGQVEQQVSARNSFLSV